MLQIKHILLPIDGSPGTQAAIDYASLLGSALRASITLVHVDQPENAMVGIVPGATVDDDLAVAQRLSTQRLDELRRVLVASGFASVEVLVLSAPTVAPALVEVARAGGFDLIVMATHARTGVARLVLGSIAEQVLRHAPCPVLTVHLPAAM